MKSRLHAACRAAADHVRLGLRSGRKAEVNATAEHGWAMFDAEWNRHLTPQQRERIAAITEHGSSQVGASGGHQHHGH